MVDSLRPCRAAALSPSPSFSASCRLIASMRALQKCMQGQHLERPLSCGSSQIVSEAAASRI